jgi:hypothetical protein
MKFVEVTPDDILLTHLGYHFSPIGMDITKTPNFCHSFKNLSSYPLGKFKMKTPSPFPLDIQALQYGEEGAHIKWDGPLHGIYICM